MGIVTVLTPTYNRADKLKRLYQSLCLQSEKNFTWLVVDDGSIDETQLLLKHFIAEQKLDICVLKKTNGGKHKALNYAYSFVKTELTFIVDSDDYLLEDAIAQIVEMHARHQACKNICGYSFMRQFEDGSINGKTFPKDEFVGNYIDVRINGLDTNADKAEVWKTSALKEYLFPEFDDEPFLGEDVVWIQLSLQYDMVFSNRAIYVSEYLEQGLTNNRRRHNINSPNGCHYRALGTLKVCENKKIQWKYFVKVMLQYHIYGWFACKSTKEQFLSVKQKLFYLLTLPIAWCIYIHWKNSEVVD